MKTLGKNLQAARLAAGMSQVKLAEKLGINQTDVSRIELRPTPIYWRRICRHADAIGVLLDELRE